MTIIPSRRGFLFGAAAVALAPAIVRASNLMPISVLKPPRLWGDGIHDDTEALEWFIEKEALTGHVRIPKAVYLIKRTVDVRAKDADVDIERSTFLLDNVPQHWLHIRDANHTRICGCNFLTIEYLTKRRNETVQLQQSVSLEPIDALLASLPRRS